MDPVSSTPKNTEPGPLLQGGEEVGWGVRHTPTPSIKTGSALVLWALLWAPSWCLKCFAAKTCVMVGLWERQMHQRRA